MKSVKLILGIHNHQPVGNFEFVFEEAYRKAYAPFIELLKEFPQIKISMHYTGIIFDWLDRHYPELIRDLRKMVGTGQVEMLGGGFYEPILAVIPDQDKIGQIQKLTRYVREKTGSVPEGMWMAERIWEPHLPKMMRQAGMRFTILDDTHFQYAGLKEQDLMGYYTTEEDGYVVNLFPISKKLRYTIPFQEPERTLEYLQSVATEDGRALVVFADDGEKFGIWPGTFKHCYTEGWLERFFTLLRDNADWIHLIHFRDALHQLRPLGRIYLPTASYAEMQHWALPVKGYQEYEDFENQLKHLHLYEDYAIYVRGGFWRNFMVKYDEVNRMHKKMRRLSKRLDMLRTVAAQLNHSAETIEMLEMAQDHIWAAQCNCPYWHGVFGGIYLNHIRYAIYRHLLLAEKLMDNVEYRENTRWSLVSIEDYNGDGYDEVLIETNQINLYFQPHHGAGLFEIDYKAAPINIGDTLTRREEGYHRKLIEFCRLKAAPQSQGQNANNEIASIHDLVSVKEKNLDQYLIYDRNLRQSMNDRILPKTTTLEQFYREKYTELFPLTRSDYQTENRSSNENVHIIFSKSFTLDAGLMHLHKQVRLIPGKSEVEFEFEIKHAGDQPVEFRFGSEFNITFLAGNADDRYYYVDDGTVTDRKLNSIGEWGNAGSVGIIDHWMNINWKLAWSPKTSFWRFPVETISLSEEGFERVYQNSCVFPFWDIVLKPEERWKVKILMTIQRHS